MASLMCSNRIKFEMKNPWQFCNVFLICLLEVGSGQVYKVSNWLLRIEELIGTGLMIKHGILNLVFQLCPL